MIQGIVTDDGVPTVPLEVAGQTWDCIIDTGFNGDLELPATLQSLVNARYEGQFLSVLAGGQTVLEDVHVVDFPFDGRTAEAEATFVSGNEVLIGTRLLREHRLNIDFPKHSIRLERV